MIRVRCRAMGTGDVLTLIGVVVAGTIGVSSLLISRHALGLGRERSSAAS